MDVPTKRSCRRLSLTTLQTDSRQTLKKGKQDRGLTGIVDDVEPLVVPPQISTSFSLLESHQVSVDDEL